MYKTFGLLLLCVQLIIGSPETEELKHNCLNDEGFSSNVKICSIKDDIAIFEFVEQSMTFRCISILWTSKDVNDTQRILKIKPAFEIYYKGAVAHKSVANEINLKIFSKYTARIAIISYRKGFEISNVHLNDQALLLDWNCKESTNLNKVCGNVKDVSKIPGTMNSYWPWFATIYQFNEGLNHQRYKSGGSVISIKYILTSVNALFYEGRLLKSTELRVYVSRTNLIPRENPETFKMYTVSKVIQHEKYKFTLENNIALLKVENYIEFNEFVKPICLPIVDREYEEFGKVVGFGKGEWDYHPLITQYNENLLSLIKRDDCLNNKFLESFKHVKTFCTNNNKKTDESGITVEIKDSGSGIYIKKDENYFIGGIISKASPADNMVVFTNVYQYLYWIESHCKTY